LPTTRPPTPAPKGGRSVPPPANETRMGALAMARRSGCRPARELGTGVGKLHVMRALGLAETDRCLPALGGSPRAYAPGGPAAGNAQRQEQKSSQPEPVDAARVGDARAPSSRSPRSVGLVQRVVALGAARACVDGRRVEDALDESQPRCEHLALL